MPLPILLKENLRLPVIGAPMFIISTPKLVIAQCLAGVVGVFPSLNARPQYQLREWIQEIKQSLAAAKLQFPNRKIAPFGVNIVALADNKRLAADLAVCVDEEVPIVVTSMRAPHDVVDAVHSYGGIHFHDVINRRHAEKAIEAGVDGVILVCNGAGGHAGALNPFAFVKEIRSFYHGTIILAGCLTSARDVLAAEIMGADCAYIGTRFIATKEANAQDDYKQMLVDSHAEDIVYTPQFTGVNASFLMPSVQRLGISADRISPPSYRKPNRFLLWWKHWRISRVKKWKDLWSAGQGVSGIHAILSVEEYVEQLHEEYDRLRLELGPH